MTSAAMQHSSAAGAQVRGGNPYLRVVWPCIVSGVVHLVGHLVLWRAKSHTLAWLSCLSTCCRLPRNREAQPGNRHPHCSATSSGPTPRKLHSSSSSSSSIHTILRPDSQQMLRPEQPSARVPQNQQHNTWARYHDAYLRVDGSIVHGSIVHGSIIHVVVVDKLGYNLVDNLGYNTTSTHASVRVAWVLII
jgi:hypothetical protein